MVRTIPAALAIALGLAPAALAGKPRASHAVAHHAPAARLTAQQARAAATTWIASLAFKGDHFDAETAAAHTATPFYSVAYDDNGAPCAAVTARNDHALAAALACLHQHADGHGKLRAWTKRDAIHLWGPLRDHAAQIKTLQKTATLFVVDDGCLSEETTLILAVAGDPAHPRVTAALAQDQSCTE